MKQQAVNPVLPSYEYLPDVEPHVFGDRVYLFGSHDQFNGREFCPLDYVCWSAPVDDLSDWRKEGTTLTRDEAPDNFSGRYNLWAPDVCCGPDGRYYMYYFTSFNNKLWVASCDTPAGRYRLHDYVQYPDGTALGERKGDIFQFDPAVFVENGKVYLYSGFGPSRGQFWMSLGKRIGKQGPIVVQLAPDMKTVITNPKPIGVPTVYTAKGTPYAGHEFFEAASMRKLNGRYYFIYSSFLGHELCYAISDRPDGGFCYGGTIVSLGNVGLFGIKGIRDAENALGNTHGSIECINGRHYVFYHRQTNGHCHSRQCCAEEVTIAPDGSISQVEVTSCGLNGRPLSDQGTFEAGIACVVKSLKGGSFNLMFHDRSRPYITQTGEDRESDPEQLVANITNGTVIGYKYFDFQTATRLVVTLFGKAKGELAVSHTETGEPIGTEKLSLDSRNRIVPVEIPIRPASGKAALYLRFTGSGRLNFYTLTLQ